MAAGGIFDSNIQVLEKVLSLRSQKHGVVSSNIANSETPGYERMKMDFEQDLARAADRSGGIRPAATHPGHIGYSGQKAISELEADVYREPVENPLGDKNNVSLDREMLDLSENRIKYEAAIRMLSKKFNMLKSVIRERA